MRRIRGLAALWAVVTAVLLLMPGGGSRLGWDLSEALVTAIELAVHFTLFFGQAYLAGRAYGGSSDGVTAVGGTAGHRSRILAAVLAYCVLLEIAQIAVPNRGFEFVDIAAGWLGAVLGIRAPAAFRRRR